MADPFWKRWWTWNTYYRDEARARRRGDFDGALTILLEHAGQRRWANALAIFHNVMPAYAATGRSDLVEQILHTMAERSAEAKDEPDHAQQWAAQITLHTAWTIDPAMLAVTEARMGVDLPARPEHVKAHDTPTPERLQLLFRLAADPAARTEALLTDLREQIIELARTGSDVAHTALALATETVARLEERGTHLAAAFMADVASATSRLVHPDDNASATAWNERASKLRELVRNGPELGPQLSIG